VAGLPDGPAEGPASGLPVGLQFAGRRGRDLVLLRVAAAAEPLIAPPAEHQVSGPA
jgi:Asp-tRNA(Asn)/Glu-tRNA(Gln) amidotransferase A subunit family amidase